MKPVFYNGWVVQSDMLGSYTAHGHCFLSTEAYMV